MTIQTLQQQSILLDELLKSVQNEHELNNVKSQFLGKKSELAEFMKQIPTLSHEDRKVLGEKINHYRQIFTEQIQNKYIELQQKAIQAKLLAETIDPTLPYENGIQKGTQHPLIQSINELLSIMTHLGFKAVSGPEIENDFHNFTALNIPPLHPARQSQDTFYVDNGNLLRTQTSSVQIRYMEANTPPHYIVSVGKVYRVDETDATHLPMFHQMECLCIDEDITLLDMKTTIHNMLKMFFMTNDLPIRFRSSYFPFTVPSMEVDMMYNGKWLELMGCGMVHTNVLKNVNIDFTKYSGFAFGLGVERLAMIKHNISDMRHLIENDMRFLKYYG